MVTTVLTLDMRSDLIYTLRIIPDADIIYGISRNFYRISIEQVTNEFIHSILCNNPSCYELGHYHNNNINNNNNIIISQSINDNILELIFNYNHKIRKFIYQHDNALISWNNNIKDFQHIIIPFIPIALDINIDNTKLMIKSRAEGQPYFYIQSDNLPIFISLNDKFKLFPQQTRVNNSIHNISRLQINMDNDIWFTNSILQYRYVKCTYCLKEYEIKNYATLEDIENIKNKSQIFKCEKFENDKNYCQFTEIYNKD